MRNRWRLTLVDVDLIATQERAEDLMEAASISVASNTLAVHKRSIRALFADIDPEIRQIRTERGHRYRAAA